jgi:cytochrome P450
MLADHPHVFARLRSEVLDTLGPRGKVTPENLRVMKYLRAVLNGESTTCLLRSKRITLTIPSETLRLYPSV